MTPYGLKISKPGYNVKTATPTQLVFNSEHIVLNIVDEGSITNTDSGYREVSMPHYLGFVPGFTGWFEVGNSGKWFLLQSLEDESGGDCRVSIKTDSSDLIIRLSSDDTRTIKVKYLVFSIAGT